MVLFSYKSHMKEMFLYLLRTKAFYLQVIFKFSLSSCVCVFELVHSSIACHKLFGINLIEKKKKMLKFPSNILRRILILH